MFNKVVLISALFAILTGCDQQRNMMTPVMQDVLMDEPVSEDTSLVEQPIIHFPIEIDDIIQEETHEVFTSSNAAINSERFHQLLEVAKEYNLEYCGKRRKGVLPGDVDNQFDFVDKATAKEFAGKVNAEYAEHLNTTERIIPERFSWWGGVDLYPRCSGIGG
ncbi:MAG: hypothetical protein OXN25_16545 [Candidatus Poribacteria bacterium]|nr:hypothetical protein [Candidatus Poribacteria bacterium]